MFDINWISINLDLPEAFQPDDPTFFGCLVEFSVRPKGEGAGDRCYAQLCTVEWYKQHVLVERVHQGRNGVFPGRGFLFVERYECDSLLRLINDVVAWSGSVDANQAYERLSRLFIYESENLDQEAFFKV